MLRFVVAPDGRLVVDFGWRLPGRGLWVAAEAAIVRRAVAKNLFAKAARRAVNLPEDLPGQVARAARERFLSHLGLAKRAGVLAIGFDAVRNAVAHRKARLMIEAADGAEEGRRKLTTSAGSGQAWVEGFTAAELGQALGRDIAVHLAVTDSAWAEGLSRKAALALALDAAAPRKDNG